MCTHERVQAGRMLIDWALMLTINQHLNNYFKRLDLTLNTLMDVHHVRCDCPSIEPGGIDGVSFLIGLLFLHVFKLVLTN